MHQERHQPPFTSTTFVFPAVPQMIDSQAMALQAAREQLLGEKASYTA